MTEQLRFDGKVILITGAGNGLGKAYALAFAERGASVVGVTATGTGKDSKAADLVVQEIISKGGRAVANYDSVEDGEKVVKTALDAFGKIDIVINNAGILRDKSFARISNDDWDIIQRIHLRGSFLVTRAAWPHMREQGYGRIIFVSSSAGIYGNFGQANYSAAKLGIAGLSNTVALEGKKYGIQCNCIAPIAGSRLTETVMPKELVQALRPEYVSPVVVYLCHDTCKETGGLFEIGAGWVGKLRWERSEGVFLRANDKAITAESVRDNWQQITDFGHSTHPQSNQESTGFMINLLNSVDKTKEDENSISTNDPVAKAKTLKVQNIKYTYTERDVVLYALSVGVSTTQDDYLKFLFELSDDFTVLPTFGVLPAFKAIMSLNGVPGFKIDPTKILHGEQYLELFKPMSRSGVLTSKAWIADILDKKSGAVILYNIETYDEKNEKVAFNQFTTFVVGIGNFGGNRTSSEAKPLVETPGRAPDAVKQEKTSVDQAALYRLNGDQNPLHIDPSFAAMGGFKTPILHGLCSFGYAVRHVMATYADNDMTRFKAVKVRFAKPVIPGQTLITDMWKEGNRIYFQTKVADNGNICITGAYVDLFTSTSDNKSPIKVCELKCTAIFQQMASQVSNNPALAAKINAVYQWNITKDGVEASNWVVDMKNTGKVYEGKSKEKADCTVTVSDENFIDLVAGKINPQKAFLDGKIKLQGNIMLAQKLGDLFANKSKI